MHFFGRIRPITLLFILLIGVFTALLGLFISYTLITESNYILHGVSIGGIPVGNQTRSEAWTTLNKQTQLNTVNLVANAQVLSTPTLQELGVTLDIQRAVNQAYQQGRDATPLVGMFKILNISVDLQPSYQSDWQVTESYLNSIAEQFYVAPQDAQLAFDGGQFVSAPPVAGQQLDVSGTLAQWRSLSQLSGSLASADMALPVLLVPIAPSLVDISPFVAQANALVAHPIQLEAYDPVVDEAMELALSAETYAAFLQFDIVDEQLTWSGNQSAIATYLDEFNDAQSGRYIDSAEAATIASAIESGQSAVALRLLHPPIIHTVVSGDTLASIGNQYGIPYPWIQALNPGVDRLSVGQEITVPSVDEMLPLPVVRNKRIVVSLAQQYMWAYENGAVKWEWPVSTGIADSPTSPGVFQIQSHELEAYGSAWDLYMPNFMGVYLPAPGLDLMNGFHGFPTRDGTNLLWTNSLGRPATYGCILVDNKHMPYFYDWAEKGVVVEIRQ